MKIWAIQGDPSALLNERCTANRHKTRHAHGVAKHPNTICLKDNLFISRKRPWHCSYDVFATWETNLNCCGEQSAWNNTPEQSTFKTLCAIGQSLLQYTMRGQFAYKCNGFSSMKLRAIDNQALPFIEKRTCLVVTNT